ncbi:MAG: hypothetical protein FJZ59_05420 [Chlamydiae bacterium]|nr:hypothetical protein [Chlamydiota bacterium]
MALSLSPQKLTFEIICDASRKKEPSKKFSASFFCKKRSNYLSLKSSIQSHTRARNRDSIVQLFIHVATFFGQALK